jgi:GrpB-like predicted nucleotidyltransferase (UPF0157 family)
VRESGGVSADSVVPYDPDWPRQFAWLRDHLTPLLNVPDCVVEHVGSTAVPGCWAKPVIDIDIVVSTEALLDQTTNCLVAAGYRNQGDLGIPGRLAFQQPPDWPTHHLYLVVRDSTPHRDHIDFRDYLRRHPTDAHQYGQLKQELADLLADDRDRYVDGKRPLIQEILRRARQQETRRASETRRRPPP